MTQIRILAMSVWRMQLNPISLAFELGYVHAY